MAIRVLLAVLCALSLGWAIPRWGKAVPVDRLTANIRAYLETHPDDAGAWYALGRVHSIAYAKGKDELYTYDPGSPEKLPDTGERRDRFLPDPTETRTQAVRRLYECDLDAKLTDEGRAKLDAALEALGGEGAAEAEDVIVRIGPRALPVAQARLQLEKEDGPRKQALARIVEALQLGPRAVQSLRAAIAAYEEGVAKGASSPWLSLGLAWCYEEAGKTEQAVARYREAYRAAIEADLVEKGWSRISGWWHGSIALEAGEGWLRLIGDPKDEATKQAIAEVKGNVVTLRRRTEGQDRAVSPILVPLQPTASLQGLIDASHLVAFDLDGSGVARLWPWPRPTAGFLVWDPEKSGEVRSGLQLFGNVTWDAFWPDGYRPLSLLDDDRDGRLSGRELDGLALWRDGDCDGVSSPGEVRPLRAWGIVALGVSSEPSSEGPRCVQGVRFATGEWRPTWDWWPESRGRARLSP